MTTRSTEEILNDLIDCVHNDGDIARDATGEPIIDDAQFDELLAWQAARASNPKRGWLESQNDALNSDSLEVHYRRLRDVIERRIVGLPDHPWIPGAAFAGGEIVQALAEAKKLLGEA